jgi:hypothetical protein
VDQTQQAGLARLHRSPDRVRWARQIRGGALAIAGRSLQPSPDATARH